MLGMGEITVVTMILITHALWICGIIEAVRKRQRTPIIAMIIFTHFVGASVYLLYCYRAEIQAFFHKPFNLLCPSPPDSYEGEITELSSPQSDSYEGETTKLSPPQ